MLDDEPSDLTVLLLRRLSVERRQHVADMQLVETQARQIGAERQADLTR